jgi:hypothetical protein
MSSPSRRILVQRSQFSSRSARSEEPPQVSSSHGCSNLSASHGQVPSLFDWMLVALATNRPVSDRRHRDDPAPVLDALIRGSNGGQHEDCPRDGVLASHNFRGYGSPRAEM